MSENDFPSLKHWLDEAAATCPDAPAIYIEDEEIGFATLREQVAALITTLGQAGIRSGERLALATDSARILALMAYAAPQLGITFLPLSPKLPGDWQQAILARAGIQHVLCDNEFSECWPGDLNVITVGQLLLYQFALGNAAPGRPEHNDIPLMLATSGSTGTPRVVMLGHDNLEAAAHLSNRHLQLGAGDVWLACLPLYHIGGLMILYRCLAARACVVLHDHFTAQKVWQDLQNHAVSHVSLAPIMLQRLLDAARDQPPPASLRFAIVGGAPLPDALAQRALAAGWPLYLSYGMTETAAQIAGRRLSEADAVPALEAYEGIEIRLQSPDEQGIGRIALRGAPIMRGYANAGDDARQPDEQGWLLTRDRGFLDENGRLLLHGRADRVIISGGENIDPAQIEHVLQACPGLEEVAVMGMADPEWGQRPVAIYSGAAPAEELEQWSRERLRGGWRPCRFIHTDRLPRLGNGKPDPQALAQLL